MQRQAHRHQAGLSLPELLVGTAVGLIVAAAAGSVVATHLRESRQLRIEARLTTDLTSTADLVARDLRRAGYWSAAASGVRIDDRLPVANPHGTVAVAGAASDAVALSFSRDAVESDHVDDSERFGFRLRRGAVETQLGAGNWQALNDPGTVVVTAFSVEARDETVSLEALCERPCATAGGLCPPQQRLRTFELTLSARPAAAPIVTRTAHRSVRVRNDAVVGSCEG